MNGVRTCRSEIAVVYLLLAALVVTGTPTLGAAEIGDGASRLEATGRPGDLLRLWAYPHWTAMLLVMAVISWLARLRTLGWQYAERTYEWRVWRSIASALGRCAFVYLPLGLLVQVALLLLFGHLPAGQLATNTVKIALLLAIVDALLERYRPRDRPGYVAPGPWIIGTPIIALFLYHLSLFAVYGVAMVLGGRFGYAPVGEEVLRLLLQPPLLLEEGRQNWAVLLLLLPAIGWVAYMVERKRWERAFW